MSDADKPHLLYVAWGFPPGRGSGVYRALATANTFASQGWRVTVLTVERETFTTTDGGDESLEAHVHPSIRIERIPFDVPVYRTNLRAWSRWRARFPEFWNAWQFVRERGIFPEAVYGAWRPVLEAEALRIHRTDPVDLTIATANPNVDFAAAFALYQHGGVPFVLDYRDAWQLDLSRGVRLSAPGSRIDQLERRYVSAAREIWFVNEPIARWHRHLYPDAEDRMHVVANGFDEELAQFPTAVRADRDEGLVFGYVGTISDVMPLPALLDGWRRARERSHLMANARLELFGYLGHAGVPSDRWSRLIREYADEGVTHGGPVAKARIAATYSRFDALVLVLGDSSFVTSGKVFEYCATGLPIVSVHAPQSAASDVLRHYEGWSATSSLRADDVAEAFIRAAELASVQTESMRSELQTWAAQFERGAQFDGPLRRLREGLR